jgi:hypothetical protein
VAFRASLQGEKARGSASCPGGPQVDPCSRWPNRGIRLADVVQRKGKIVGTQPLRHRRSIDRASMRPRQSHAAGPQVLEGKSLMSKKFQKALATQRRISILAAFAERGCSSVVEHFLAKEDVESSNLFTRSTLQTERVGFPAREILEAPSFAPPTGASWTSHRGIEPTLYGVYDTLLQTRSSRIHGGTHSLPGAIPPGLALHVLPR